MNIAKQRSAVWERVKTIALSEHIFNVRALENSKLFLSSSNICVYLLLQNRNLVIVLISSWHFICSRVFSLEKLWPCLLYRHIFRNKLFSAFLVSKFTAKIAFTIHLKLSLSTTCFYMQILLWLGRVCLYILVHRAVLASALTADVTMLMLSHSIASARVRRAVCFWSE